jgi:hypothetical protein
VRKLNPKPVEAAVPAVLHLCIFAPRAVIFDRRLTQPPLHLSDYFCELVSVSNPGVLCEKTSLSITKKLAGSVLSN